MKELKAKYIKLGRDIRILEFFVIFLLTLLITYTTWSLINKGLEKSTGILEQLGILVSVLLVSKVARRQLLHSDITQTNTENLNVVRVTHHLMTVVDDLKKKISFIKDLIKNEDGSSIPVNIVITLINDINNAYKALRDKDVHDVLHGKTLNIIWDMSAHISDLYLTADIIAKTGLREIPIPSSIFNSDVLISSIEALLSKLEEIDNQLRELRNSIEVPKELEKKYDSIT